MDFKYDSKNHILVVTLDDGIIKKFFLRDDTAELFSLILQIIDQLDGGGSGGLSKVEPWAEEGSTEKIPLDKLEGNEFLVTTTDYQGRKTIQLQNYDSISGLATDGAGYNIAMVSKWDKVDLGSAGLTMNLNSKDGVVQINDEKTVAANEDIENWAKVGDSTLIPSEKLPGFVDDIVDGYYDAETGLFYTDAEHTTEIAGESGKIYVDITDLSKPKQYRWSGSAFVPIESGGVVIGTVTGTAMDGGIGTNHINNTNIHVTKEEKEKWNQKSEETTAETWAQVGNSDTIPLNKMDENVVQYSDFSYVPSGEETPVERKTIQLKNYDSISGINTAGNDAANLIMMSKWDKVDIGSSKYPVNLNGSEFTINDNRDIAKVYETNGLTSLSEGAADSEIRSALGLDFDKLIEIIQDKDVVIVDRTSVGDYKACIHATGNISGGNGAANLMFFIGTKPTIYQIQYVSGTYALAVISYEFVPSTRTVAGKALSEDITLSVVDLEDGDTVATKEETTNVTSIPIRTNLNKTYTQSEIFGWFGVDDISSLKRQIIDRRFGLRFGISLSGRPMYYNIPIQYIALEDDNTLRIIAMGLDTSDDTPSKYDITIKLDGTLITETSNISVVITPIEDTDLTNYVTTEILTKTISEERKAITKEIETSTSNFVTNENLPKTLPNPHALTIKYNEVKENEYVYDGSEAITISIPLEQEHIPTSTIADGSILKSTPTGLVAAEGDKDYVLPETVEEEIGKAVEPLATNENVFGDLTSAKYGVNSGYIAQVIEMSASYVSDLGNPERVNGYVFNADTNNVSNGTEYLVFGKFDEELVFHWEAWDTAHLPVLYKTILETVGGKLDKTALNDYAKKTEIPTALPNPQALTINYNGTQVLTYNGADARTTNFKVNAETVPMSEDDNETISQKISDMDTQIAKISELQSTIASLTSRIELLENKVANLESVSNT